MDLELSGRVALVAAASQGIGRGIARSLGREGCRLVITSSNARRLKRARDVLRKDGLEVEARVMDVRSAASIKATTDAVLKRWGRVDILIANGPGPEMRRAAEVTDEQISRALEANLLSVVRLCRAVLPGMIKARYGRIIVLASTTAREPDEDMVLSNMTRAAAVSYAKTLSREVGRHGVTVNSMLTGSVMTDRTLGLLRQSATRSGITLDKALQQATALIPTGRIPSADEFADLVAFIASPRASHVNGASLPADGGLMRGL